MKALFIIWMICYPLATSAGKWLLAHRNKMEGYPPITHLTWLVDAIIDLAVYVLIGVLLLLK